MIGQRIGTYEVRELLGSGGMGEVYRARDSRLGRDVAIKILPEAFARDPERLGRFEREARVLAALSHPHIAAIYGVTETEPPALILELVDGPTLADRIAQGRLPLAAVLAISAQIADALDAAHEKGIVHRDLKPANIKIARDGSVKILDFGLAKILDAADPASDQGATSIETTHAGAVLGTPAYMCPEQARGLTIDKRADIWAFGCLLFEMLARRPPFGGDTVSDAIARVLEREPDWSALPETTPSAIRRLIARCLEKDMRRRLRDIGDARAEIAEAVAAPAAESAPVTRRRTWTFTAGAIGIVLVAAAVMVTIVSPPRTPREARRLSIYTPGLITPQLSATISPDGRTVAFVASDGSGKSVLWLRPLDSLDARPLPGTESAAHPSWSPDNRWLAFMAEGKVKKASADGATVQTLAVADVGLRTGVSWGRTGTILFIRRLGEIAAVPENGGTVTTVLQLDPKRWAGAFWPHFLPDGRHFLYYATSANPAEQGVYAGEVGSTERRLVLASDYKAAYASGYLLFVRDESLMAQPFDPDRLELTGQPALVADGVWSARSAAQASFTASSNGVLAYVNASLANTQLSWVDRQGRPLGAVGPPARSRTEMPSLAPDDTRIAIGHELQGIWMLDSRRGTSARVTYHAGQDSLPLWSGDGQRFLFQSREGTSAKVYVKQASGAGEEQAAFESAAPFFTLEDWSADGQYVAYIVNDHGQSDLWVHDLVGGNDRRFLQTPFNETQAQISPDGRWIAYTANESGGDQVYVQSFPRAGSKRQISTNGGVQPRWRGDGRELFYVAGDQMMMAVPVAGGPAFDPGGPTPLFRSKVIPQGSQSLGLFTQYDVSSDGQRFLFNIRPEDPGPPITVVLDWIAGLRK